MDMHMRIALDNWITGHYGEDQFRGRRDDDDLEGEDAEGFTDDEISPVDEEEFHWRFIKDKGEPQ